MAPSPALKEHLRALWKIEYCRTSDHVKSFLTQGLAIGLFLLPLTSGEAITSGSILPAFADCFCERENLNSWL